MVSTLPWCLHCATQGLGEKRLPNELMWWMMMVMMVMVMMVMMAMVVMT